MHIKGLLEMMFDKLAGWIDGFILDMEVCACLRLQSCRHSYSLNARPVCT